MATTDIDQAALRRWAGGLRGTVILPGDAAYDAARRVWNRAIDRHPAAILRCGAVDDVRRAVEFARTHHLPLAIRSGGHSQAGLGTVDDGLVLDLGAWRWITVDETRRVARVAAGARVAEVLDATRAHRLVTPMGGCPDVGVGGLTLGGGENFLMGTHAAVCDNVVAAEVVTADGEVLVADAHAHQDLFWAVRGGGGNVGIVTWFEYRLFELPEMLSGRLLFPIARARDVLRGYRDLIAREPDELDTSLGLSTLEEGPVFAIAFAFSGVRSEGERWVADFRRQLRPDRDDVAWAPYSADMVVPPAPSEGSGLFLPDLTDEAIDRFADAVRRAPDGAAATFNHLHGAVTRVAPDATAFPLRRRGFDLFISVPWESAEARAAAGAWVESLAGALRPFARGVYVNNLAAGEDHRVAEAYGVNVERLARIKARYDPGNLFRVNHNVAPAADGAAPSR